MMTSAIRLAKKRILHPRFEIKRWSCSIKLMYMDEKLFHLHLLTDALSLMAAEINTSCSQCNSDPDSI